MGGAKKPDYKVRPPSATGGNRTDMQGRQPVTVPTGMAYGDRTKLEHAQEQMPLMKDKIGTPNIGQPIERSSQELGDLLSGSPSMYPQEAVTARPNMAPSMPEAPANAEWVRELISVAIDPRASEELKLLAVTMAHAYAEGGNEFFPQGI